MRVDVSTLLTSLCTGRLDVNLLNGFPEQDAPDRVAGDEWVAKAETVVREHIDPENTDDTGELPAGLIDALRGAGFLTFAFDADLGGAGLSAKSCPSTGPR
ncbi:hypothetical protein [Actinocrispum sp. NPDC049592]|uniref:hypothetical protein n=1 Tax=Actinocrispum sp. NPDC049592 TaxID=3154835 RepID=UPI003444F1B8